MRADREPLPAEIAGIVGDREGSRGTERFRRPIFGKLEIDITVEDPKACTKPFTVRINQRFLADEEPIEFVCNENQQFRERIKID